MNRILGSVLGSGRFDNVFEWLIRYSAMGMEFPKTAKRLITPIVSKDTVGVLLFENPAERDGPYPSNRISSFKDLMNGDMLWNRHLQ